jgi:hypothetical protein
MLRPVHVRQARVQLGRLVEQPREELAHAAPRARPARLAPPAAGVRGWPGPGRGAGGHLQALLGRPGHDAALQLRRAAQADGVRQGQPGRGAGAAACAGLTMSACRGGHTEGCTWLHCQASGSRPLGAGASCRHTRPDTACSVWAGCKRACASSPKGHWRTQCAQGSKVMGAVRGVRAGARTTIQPLYEAASVVELARVHEPDRLCDHLQADGAQVLILAHGACARASTGSARAPQPCHSAALTPGACIAEHQPRAVMSACLATSYQPGMSTREHQAGAATCKDGTKAPPARSKRLQRSSRYSICTETPTDWATHRLSGLLTRTQGLRGC